MLILILHGGDNIEILTLSIIFVIVLLEELQNSSIRVIHFQHKGTIPLLAINLNGLQLENNS